MDRNLELMLTNAGYNPTIAVGTRKINLEEAAHIIEGEIWKRGFSSPKGMIIFDGPVQLYIGANGVQFWTKMFTLAIRGNDRGGDVMHIFSPSGQGKGEKLNIQEPYVISARVNETPPYTKLHLYAKKEKYQLRNPDAYILLEIEEGTPILYLPKKS